MSRGRKLILIRKSFGIEAQEQKLLEEIGEFIEAVNDMDAFDDMKNQDEYMRLLDHVLEEATDCMIVALQLPKKPGRIKATKMVRQIIIKFIMTSNKISIDLFTLQVLQRHFDYKIERTLKKIQEVKNGTNK